MSPATILGFDFQIRILVLPFTVSGDSSTVVISSNFPHYPEVVKRLREAGHEVYDFRNPPQGAAVSTAVAAPTRKPAGRSEGSQM